MNNPSFFVLGAARSGSTFLHSLLRQHPNIFLPAYKEPTFFCRSFQGIKNPIDYLGLFPSDPKYKAIGEASHAYLTDPESPRAIKTIYPNAKFIVVLRDPVERAYSLYHWMRKNGYEPINSFERALLAEKKRKNSRRFAAKPHQYLYNSLYIESGMYGKQLSRYLKMFDPSNFLALRFSDLTSNPLAAMSRSYEFLGVDKSFLPTPEAEQNNICFTARNALLQYLIVSRIGRLGSAGNKVKNIMVRANRAKVPSLNHNTRVTLRKWYSADQELLKSLVDISFKEEWGNN